MMTGGYVLRAGPPGTEHPARASHWPVMGRGRRIRAAGWGALCRPEGPVVTRRSTVMAGRGRDRTWYGRDMMRRGRDMMGRGRDMAGRGRVVAGCGRYWAC